MDPVEVKHQPALFVIFPENFGNSDQNFRIFYPSQKSFSHETFFLFRSWIMTRFAPFQSVKCFSIVLVWVYHFRMMRLHKTRKAFGCWERVHLRWKTRLKPVFHFLHFSYNEESLLSLKNIATRLEKGDQILFEH